MFKASLLPYLFIAIFLNITSFAAQSNADANNDYLDVQKYLLDPANNNHAKYQFLRDHYLQLGNNRSIEYKRAILIQLMLASARLADLTFYEQWQETLTRLPSSSNNSLVLAQLQTKAQIEQLYFLGDYLAVIQQGKDFLSKELTVARNAKLNYFDEQLFLTRLDIASLTNLIGVAYFLTGDYKQAQQHFLSAINEYEHLKDPFGQTHILNNLSLISWVQKSYQEALSYLEKAEEISRKIGDENGVLASLTNQGIYYHELAQFDNAIQRFNAVIEFDTIDQYPKIAVSALLAKSATLMQAGESEKSKVAVEQAQSISQTLKNPLYATRSQIALADIYIAENAPEQGLVLLEDARRFFQDKQLLKEEADVTLTISQAHENIGDYQKSLEQYEYYHRLSTDLLSKAQSVSINQIKKQHQLAMRDKTIKLLKQENHLKNAEISAQHDTYTLVVTIIIGLGVIFMLSYNWYFSRKKFKSLRAKNLIIKENEKQLLLLSYAFKNTSDAVCITDANGIIEAVNNSFVKHTHYLKSEVLGLPVRIALVEGQDKDLMTRILHQAKVDGSWRGELFGCKGSNKIYPVELEIEVICNDAGEVINYLGVFRDITDKKEAEKQLTQLATHHKTTQLPNRTLFQELLNQACVNVAHTERFPTVIYIELTNYKQVIDLHGHEYGEQLICDVANRINKTIQDKDILGHFNNDEFCLLAELRHPKRGGAKIAQKLLSALEAPFNINHSPFKADISIGITFYPDDANNADELIRKAAIAMIDVKTTQKHHYRFYEQHMNEEVTLQLEREQRLLNAINNRYFEFYYQPILEVSTHKIVSAEALIRWIEPNGYMVPPNDFIPLAEQCGYIDLIDRIVIDNVFRQKSLWQKNGIEIATLSLNISAKMFGQPQELITLLQAKTSQYQVDASKINIEITEGMLLENLNEAIDTMHRIKSLGFSLSLDDFGTGYSSLSYLKLFPIDTLKIDRSFIKGIHESSTDESIVRAIIALAKTLSLKVVAEGVEYEEHSQILAKSRCDFYQGYFASKPLPVTEFETHLALKKPLTEIDNIYSKANS